jgi:hypothetical protein
MRRHAGMSFIEIVLAVVLLLALIVPLGRMLSHANLETRSSLDEFFASLYLTELLDQAAAMPWQVIPVGSEPREFLTSDPVALDPAHPESVLHLAPMRVNFTSRTLQVRAVEGTRGALKELRAVVAWRSDRRDERRLAMVTMVGSGGGRSGVTP